jgi:putative ABC transport system permease protein
MRDSGNASVFRLAARQISRDFVAGELRLLLWAVVLAVAALAAVGFFADRMRGGLVRDAAQLLGGDAIVQGDRPLDPAFEREARARGLVVSHAATFPSMARAAPAQGGAARLASVKAVDAAYPLRGAIRVRLADGAQTQALHRAPAPGTAWVDRGLASALGLKIGDPIQLGDASLELAGFIVIEPDRGTGFGALAPRLMLSLADLDATGLVQPTSRIGWRLAVAAGPGQPKQVGSFTAWAGRYLKDRGLRGVHIETLESGRPEMRQTLDRAEQFLSLVALLTALLAAVAVAVAARDFAQRHLDDCAMLRVLGQTQARIAAVHALEFVFLGLAGSAAGLALGWGLQLLFVALLAGFMPEGLPLPGPGPALLGLGIGLTLVLAFGLPPVLQLARVPPLRVLRRDVGTPKIATIGVLGGGLAGFALLLLAAARDPRLGAFSVGGFAAAALLFAGTGWLAVHGLRRFMPGVGAPRWILLATRAVAARPALAVLQVASMAIGLMALWLLVLLRTDLIDSWRASTPPDAPDRFVINVQPDQANAFRATLDRAGIRDYDWYPMIRGRLDRIDGAPVGPRFANQADARRLTDREFNLSYSLAVPRHNEVVEGRWTPGAAGEASVEQGLARTLGLHLGDRLSFDVAGQPLEARVASIRKLDWGSMRVNFFVMLTVSDLGDFPTSYISAFRAPPASTDFDNRLAQAFPNLTSIDVSATIAQLQAVLDQVIRAVELLFVFALVAGLVVLLATVAATREARAREFAVMRAVGASASLLGRVQQVELAGVGALAGLLASAAAMAVGWVLAMYVFDFHWNPPLWVPLAGAVSGGLLAWLAGAWSLHGILARPVMETLRRAASE